MKILALDLGDQWVGTALSDALGITSRPYKTVTARDLETFLTTFFKEEPAVGTVVVGHPKTMSGTISDQTKKIESSKEDLAKKFPTKNWILWDERLTSQQAARIKPTKSKEDKQQSHSIAAALILQNYLDRLQFQKEIEEDF